MKKIICIILALIIIAGIVITATIGLNVDLDYKAHQEVNVYLGKETNSDEIEVLARDVFKKQKIKVTTIESFNDAFTIKVENVSDEQIETLKQKVGEKFNIEDTSNIITKSSVGRLRLIDLVKPYILPNYYMPIIFSTIIVLVYMALRYKKIGSIKIILQTMFTLILAETFLISIIAITRYPVNQYVVPTALAVYALSIVSVNVQAVKDLNKITE